MQSKGRFLSQDPEKRREMMSGYQQRHGSFKGRILKVIICIMAFCLTGYIIGPPLYWHTSEALASRFSCPPCLCHDDCSTHSLPSISQGLNITSFTACMKNDPDMSEDMEKTIVNQLSEELKLMESEATDKQHIADKTLLDTKKMVSQYQKEADKCTSGMGTCEEAREKAEVALKTQKDYTAMWELRARQKGWKDENVTASLKIFDQGLVKTDDIDHM